MNSSFETKTIMFDLDGTLVDSVPDLSRAIDKTCTDIGLPMRGIERVRQWVGNGVRTLVARALANSMTPCTDDAAVDAAYGVFYRHYTDCCCNDVTVYPSVQDTLNTLKETGYKLALITNKQNFFTKRTLEHLGWSELFDLVLSFDSLPHAKPHPLPLLRAMETLGVPGIFVGDSSTDVEAAGNAGVPIVVTSYGYNHGEPIEAAGPNVVIDRLRELLNYIEPHSSIR